MHRVIILGLVTVLLTVHLPAGAETPQVSLHIDAPNSNGGLALLSESGWPFTIKMVVDLPEGEPYPAYAVQPDFASTRNFGFLVLSDPDGCMNAPVPGFLPDFGCALPPVIDETWIEFWPDIDQAGVADGTGNTDRQSDLVDSAGGGGPEFQIWDAAGVCTPHNSDADCQVMGPVTGGEVVDGFGFGTDDDLPGLVIISEHGAGLVFDEPDFELSSPRGAVNLAGFINSVSYDLSDLHKTNSKSKGSKGKPSEIIIEQSRFWAHMTIPHELIRNLVQYDACTGDVDFIECSGDNLWRVDGGPVEVPPQKYDNRFTASADVMNAATFTMTAFLVSGHAPDRLFDEDGDGDIDSDDAGLAGYTVISNEDSESFLLHSDTFCFGGGGGSFSSDLDGNGADSVVLVCPPGPGDVSRPPR